MTSKFLISSDSCILMLPYTDRSRQYDAQCGVTNRAKDTATEQTRFFELQDVTFSLNSYHRIVLINIRDPFKLNNFVKPVLLRRAGLSNVTGLSNRPRLFGWNMAGPGVAAQQTLSTGEQNLITNADCETRFRQNVPPRWLPDYERYHMFCAVHDQTSPCIGDEGGPLLVVENGEWLLIGILKSVSKPCGVPGKRLPSIYIIVSNFIDWIAQPLQTGMAIQEFTA